MPDRGGDTQNLLDEMSDLEDNISHSSFSSPAYPSRMSTPLSTRSSSSSESRKRATPSYSKQARSSVDPQCSTSNVPSNFKLPVFSPEIKRCIQKDAFYTSAQRNRLIKEACLALRGYYWEKEQAVSNEEKRNLAKTLLELAPKSLGDSCSTSSLEVSQFYHQDTQPCMPLLYRQVYMVK